MDERQQALEKLTAERWRFAFKLSASTLRMMPGPCVTAVSQCGACRLAAL